MKLNELIKQKREEMKLSQRALAKLAKCSYATISYLESSDTKLVNKKILTQLSKTLNIPQDDFINAYLESIKERLK